MLQGVFPTFVFVKKLALRPLFLLGFFMGCLGWRCFAESARILLYLVGFFYAGTFFLFFCGWFWKSVAAVVRPEKTIYAPIPTSLHPDRLY